jgi:hypothetical protein
VARTMAAPRPSGHERWCVRRAGRASDRPGG